MKTLKKYRVILSATIFFLTATRAYSYPPDNAAVLYYKAAVLYEIDDEMKNKLADLLADLRVGKVGVNDQIREFVQKNRRIINTVLDAAEVKNCDWGMDFSQGMEMDMPPLGRIRDLAFLVMADAKILAEDGDYEGALSRCMSLYKTARHVNDRIFISTLVGISINGLSNECVMQIMSDMPQDMQSLTWLKTQLIVIDSIPFSIKPALLGEREAMLSFMTPGNMEDVAGLCDVEESIKEEIISFSDDMIARNREYYENHVTGVFAAFDMPYVQGYTAMENLDERVEEDVKSNPDATLTQILAPAVHKMFSHLTSFYTHNNAIKTAIVLYMIKADKGKLPDTLPDALPGDLFSNKPFVYEKIPEGFILRCQGKDLSRDKVYEYEFKIKK